LEFCISDILELLLFGIGSDRGRSKFETSLKQNKLDTSSKHVWNTFGTSLIRVLHKFGTTLKQVQNTFVTSLNKVRNEFRTWERHIGRAPDEVGTPQGALRAPQQSKLRKKQNCTWGHHKVGTPQGALRAPRSPKNNFQNNSYRRWVTCVNKALNRNTQSKLTRPKA